MTEYIEREAAIDAIMKVYVRTAGYKARERVFEAKEAVHRLPVADVAPVVRCKDCRDYDMASGFCQCHSQYYDSSMSWDVFREDDFCSYGERMDCDEDALD